MKYFYNWYVIVLTALVFLPFLAPIFLGLGLDFLAKPIYFIYSFTCHQFDHRSLHILDHQVAWCSRDTAIWLSFWLVALLVKRFHFKPIKLFWLIPFVIPIALDGGIQTIYTMFDINPIGINDGMPLYVSNNFIRYMTGSIFGIGISLWISPTIYHEAVRIDTGKEIAPKLKRRWASVGTISIALLLYLSFVQLWSLSSKDVKPYGSLDFVVRTPSEDFFERRRTGSCPTNSFAEDDYKNPWVNMLATDCFF